jgi:hypothetical protein
MSRYEFVATCGREREWAALGIRFHPRRSTVIRGARPGRVGTETSIACPLARYGL